MRGRLTTQLPPLLFLGVLFSATCTTSMARPLFCSANEVVGTDASGQPRCVPAPTGAIVIPVCDTALGSNEQKIYCTSPPSPPNQDVVAVLDQLVNTTVAVQARLQLPTPPTRYVGSTTTVVYGDFTVNAQGFYMGFAAAAKLCSEQFGSGAHLCVMDELYQSAVDGSLSATSTITPSWVYMPNWNTPAVNPTEPLRGLADNCGAYTYHSQANHWRGMLVEWSPLPDGTPGLRWHGGDDAPCLSQHPIACCR